MRGEAPDLDAECGRYATLLQEHPLDVVCVGIGENGHLAFNDPPVADFDDAVWVKVIEPDDACRRQQVNEGAFASTDEMPRLGLTLTIPALMAGRTVICTVPGPRKAPAVRQTLQGAISTACPASILRRHPGATLYLDSASAAGVV
jgi:glucosamine-6-phosphate deaminase